MAEGKPEKPLQISLLGEFELRCGAVPRPLPKSRKTRGLLAYLALTGRRHRRDALCGLFWDLPNDPRASLRWSLSKLRSLLETEGGSALLADQQLVVLDETLVAVDLLELKEELSRDPSEIPDERLVAMEARFGSGCLAGLDVSDSIDYQMWLESERGEMRLLHSRILAELLGRLSDSPEMALPIARKMVALDPLDGRANLSLLELTRRTGGRKEAQAVLEEARGRYRAAGLPDLELLAAWRRSDPEISLVETAPEIVGRPVIEQPHTRILDTSGNVLALPDKPSLAVLGFDDLGGHESGSVFANGLAADLSTHLSQLQGLFVAARASAARIASERADLSEIGRLLGVRYLIHGTTQRLDRRIRVTVTLVDATKNQEVWAERYDRPFDDLFSVQDDITGTIVSTVEPEIERAEMERARLKPPESLSAWECFHRALWHCFRFTSGDAEAAERYLRNALEMDPQFARAHAGLSFTHFSRAFLNTGPDIDREIALALENARQSVDFDGRDSMGHWCVGRALFLSREHDQALAAIDQSLLRNPNYAQGHYARGFIGVHSGIPEDAVPELDIAQRLSPFDPLLFAMKASHGISLAIQGRFDEAAALCVRATHEPNAHFHIYALAAACLELAGRSEEARKNAKWALNMHPGYNLSVFQRSFPYKLDDHRLRMVEAMGKAGIPS